LAQVGEVPSHKGLELFPLPGLDEPVTVHLCHLRSPSDGPVENRPAHPPLTHCTHLAYETPHGRRGGPFDKLRVSGREDPLVVTGREVCPLVVSLSNHTLSERDIENQKSLARLGRTT